MIGDMLEWFRDQWEAGWLWMYEQMLNLLLVIINSLGLPTAMQNMDSYFAAIPSGTWWLLNAFQIQTGITIIVSSYIIRFFIRRLPIIG